MTRFVRICAVSALLVFASLAMTDGATAPVVDTAHAAKKKSKKCKRGYKRSGKKCVRRLAKPSEVKLTWVRIRNKRLELNGYAKNGGQLTTQDAFLSAKLIISDGIGKQTIKVNWFWPVGNYHIDFTGTFKVTLNSPDMFVKMQVGDVTSPSVVAGH